MALAKAAELDLSRPEISAIARRGSASAARAVTGGFSYLHAGLNDEDCRSERIPSNLGEDMKIVIGLVPAHKDTDDAHREAESSHMFQARMAHVHGQLQEMRNALRNDDFDDVFEIAEHDSLSLAATTMTGDDGWVYWKPATLAIFDKVRELREAEDIPVYFSTDTGATVYVNTTEQHADFVEEQISAVGVNTTVWDVGGPARLLDESEALF
jgi:phosphomevalonate decarboxylase